jgi:serine/threonine protein kinase
LFLYELASGLIVLHEHKIVHRDIKLENVFVTKEKHCKIGDFNLSKKVENSFGTTASVVGTSFLHSPFLLCFDMIINFLFIFCL